MSYPRFCASWASLGRVLKGTVLNADEAASWDGLHGEFEMKRINHQEAYSLDGACTNWAEEYFSRVRRAEIGHHPCNQRVVGSIPTALTKSKQRLARKS